MMVEGLEWASYLQFIRPICLNRLCFFTVPAVVIIMLIYHWT